MMRDFPAHAARSPAAQALAEIHSDSIARRAPRWDDALVSVLIGVA